MSIATIPATAKVSHIRNVLQRLRNSVRRGDAAAIQTALDYLDDVERELRK